MWWLLLPLAAAALFARSGSRSRSERVWNVRVSSTPARDMTLSEAMAELRTYAEAKAITFLSKTEESPLRLTLSPEMFGVTYLYAGAEIPLRGLDARFAVLLARLAKLLAERFGATQIDTYGIYPGRDANDVHAYGRAIDLSAVTIMTPAGAKKLFVSKDWGDRPAPNAGLFKYRLTPADAGYDLFRTIYDFLARQASDTSVEPRSRNPATSIGDHSFILHPDHPDPAQRPHHQDHIHAQIGPTSGADPFAK